LYDSLSKTLKPKEKEKVNIKKIKLFALEKLPKNWLLREIILSEHDQLDVNEFITKTEVWSKLFRSEK